MTGVSNLIFLTAFFGIALVIGIYFNWILLRIEMAGRSKSKPDTYDYGFGPTPPDPRPRH